MSKRQHEGDRPEYPREPRPGIVHAIRPNMWAACGWCICGCAGNRGEPWVLRRYTTDGVTCPACIAELDRLRALFTAPAHHALPPTEDAVLW